MMNFKGCRTVVTAAAAAVCLTPLLTACGGPGHGGSITTPARAATLTDAEIRYGVSPTRNSQVTYQDDVIVMEHGADAIRSQSSDGLTWTIDASAPGAQDIQPDKILFATGRVVGRVLAVERIGSDLAVTLGPMELTDVIKDAQITYSGALDLDKMTVYMAPDYPGTFTDRDAPEEQSAMRRQGAPSIQVVRFSPSEELVPLSTGQSGSRPVRSAVWTDRDRTHFQIMPAAYMASDMNGPSGGGGSGGTGSGAVPSDIPIGGFHFAPDVRKGLGVSATHTERGMKFTAYAKLHLDNPNFTFRLDIAHAKLKTAEVELSGVGGVQVGFKGGTNGEFKNPNQAFELLS
jgi:hypothetical protein